MNPLETEDAGWVDSLADSVNELSSLCEHLERELGNEQERYGRGPRPWGSSDMSDAMLYGFSHSRRTTSRYYSYVMAALDRASWALNNYKYNMKC